MGIFQKRKWVVVSKEIQPSQLEVMTDCGVSKARGNISELSRRTALIHYRDELSGEETVKAIKL